MTSFMRFVEIHVGNRIFNGNDFEIAFEVPFDDDSEVNETVFEIYNLSSNTINNMKKNEKVVINAGYRSSYGMILSGTISKKETKLEDVDQPTIVHVFDSTDKWSGKSISKTYKKNIKASKIITDLAKTIKLPVVIKLPKDTTYPKGFVANGKFMDICKRIASDCKAIAYVNKGKLYIRNQKAGDDIRFVLNSNTGLIGFPEPFEEDGKKGYKVKCLLNHRITVASIIQLDSLVVKGTFRVKEGRHICKGNDFYTEMEVFAA